jgi:hypothetical protein
MNALKTLERFSTLRSIPRSEDTARFLMGQLGNLPESRKKDLFAQSPRGGGVYVYESPDYPGKVLEVVAGVRTDDQMACLYEGHPIFNTPGELVKAREELIQVFEHLHRAIPGTLFLPDPGRGRHCELREVATMQLCDVIAKRFKDKGY